jgi:hypothetical protein
MANKGGRKIFRLCMIEFFALIIVSADFQRQEGRARVFLEERQAV